MEQKEVRQWCMFMHLSQLAGYIIPFAGIIVPIVMWQMKKDESAEIDAHGHMILNVMLSYFLYWVIAILLCFLLIGFLLIPLVAIAAVAMPVIGAIKANDGVLWNYPLVIRFIG